MIPSTTAAAPHLQTVIRHWPDLRDMLTTPTSVTWPPSGLNAYLRALDDLDRAEIAAERADTDPNALGESAAPLRIHVLDTMRTVETALVALADQIAAEVQRPTLTVATGQGWSDDLHRQAALLAATDSADGRRWRYSGQRTAVHAAAWLHDRLTGAVGPFRPLSDAHIRHIANVAQGAAERVERALGTARQSRALPEPCPHCRGALEVHGGDGAPPAIHCTSCRRTWRDTDTAA